MEIDKVKAALEGDTTPRKSIHILYPQDRIDGFGAAWAIWRFLIEDGVPEENNLL